MRLTRRSALVLFAVLALALSACGDSNDDSDEARIHAVLERAFVSFDADACTEILTPRALEQVEFSDSEDALESCVDGADDPDDNAEAIEVPDLEVSGDDATAIVTPQGGSIDGASIGLELVDRDGWRIDRIASLEVLDRERFLEASMREIVEDDSLLAGQGRCVADRVGAAASDAELERMYVDQDVGFLYDAIRACIGDGTDYGTISVLLRQELEREQGLSRAQAECVVGRLRPVIERYTVENFDEVTEDERFRAAAAAAGLVCVGPGGPQGTPPDQT